MTQTQIDLDKIRTGGGTQPRVNYVAEFSNGSVKTGVTANPSRRIRELERSMQAAGISLLRAVATTPCAGDAAFKIEAATCRLLSYLSQNHSKEWFYPRCKDEDIFDFIQQTIGMFWNMNNQGALVEYREVAPQ